MCWKDPAADDHVQWPDQYRKSRYNDQNWANIVVDSSNKGNKI